MIRKTLFSAAVVLLLASGVAGAAPLVWTLTNVEFDDGGTATGFIEFDAALAAAGPCDPVCPGLIDGSITVSGGDQTTFPPFTYDATNVLAETFPPDPPRFPGHIFTIKRLADDRLLSLYTASPLTDAGGTVDLIQIDSFVGSVECYNCDPFRRIVSGSLTAIPLPAAAWLFLSAIGLLGWLRRKAA
ncbi:MAG: hypothetical protein QNJ73_04865 [Gammaproteobacteria bacterium]|nr:hypothetical protein [Gammaproteobacteria bacterium]